jgi:hypothetical protein
LEEFDFIICFSGLLVRGAIEPYDLEACFAEAVLDFH